ncbi:MAG: DegT/DnrJ/EryC1/StrS family aminotransferase [Candidatus Nanopelagicales bacterium]
MIAFLDPRPREADLVAAIDAAWGRVTASGRYLLGAELEGFEHALARHEEVEHCVAVGSGLDALFLLLKAHGIGPGDEVIVPSNTFIATWLAVAHCGATPVPVDPDPATFNLDAGRVAQAITSATAAVVPVHLYGRPAPMAALEQLAERHGLLLVADAAQSIGSRYQGRRASSYGHGAATSFYPGKNLGAMGDGGAVLTHDASIARAVRALRNYGSSGKHEHPADGWNSRLDEIQAAVLHAKLPYLDAWNERRAALATLYAEALSGSVATPPDDDDEFRSSWHLYVIRSADRERLRAGLTDRGIEHGIHYPRPPHRQGAFDGFASRRLPVADELATSVLSLPLGPYLAADDARAVAEAVRGRP